MKKFSNYIAGGAWFLLIPALYKGIEAAIPMIWPDATMQPSYVLAGMTVLSAAVTALKYFQQPTLVAPTGGDAPQARGAAAPAPEPQKRSLSKALLGG